MPELPEVEAARSLVQRTCGGKKIVKAIVADDNKVFAGASQDTVRKALEGRTLKEALRKAKYLWMVLDEGPFPVFHFGMTGSISVKGVGTAKYKLTKVDLSEWPPKFCKLELEFEDGTRLAFTDPRRFGRVLLQSDPLREAPLAKLGFDCLTELPSLEQFRQMLAKYGKSASLRLKALLLDQGFTAGVGNWVADEVLYQSNLHPEQAVSALGPQHVEALYSSLRHVINYACEVDADSERFPKDWLFHYRWTGKKASSVNGHRIEFVTVGSRTSAFVPDLQKIIGGKGKSATEATLLDEKADAEEDVEQGPKAKRGGAKKPKAAAAPATEAAKGGRGRAKAKAGAKEDGEEEEEEEREEGVGPSLHTEATVVEDEAAGAAAAGKQGKGQARGGRKGGSAATATAAAEGGGGAGPGLGQAQAQAAGGKEVLGAAGTAEGHGAAAGAAGEAADTAGAAQAGAASKAKGRGKRAAAAANKDGPAVAAEDVTAGTAAAKRQRAK